MQSVPAEGDRLKQSAAEYFRFRGHGRGSGFNLECVSAICKQHAASKRDDGRRLQHLKHAAARSNVKDKDAVQYDACCDIDRGHRHHGERIEIGEESERLLHELVDDGKMGQHRDEEPAIDDVDQKGIARKGGVANVA